jgi:hypothetical protein
MIWLKYLAALQEVHMERMVYSINNKQMTFFFIE